MINVATFYKLVSAVREGSDYRYGQAVWNTAERVFQLSRDNDRIMANDPFYNDDKVDDFIAVLVEFGYLKW